MTGSSTVLGIAQELVQRYVALNSTQVNLDIRGTGAGFEMFCAGKADLLGASRSITASEIFACGKSRVKFIELPVALDGIAVIVSPENDWVNDLSVDELRYMWTPSAEKRVNNWSHIREGFPDRKMNLHAPAKGHGTFDVFTKRIVGKVQASREDYKPAADGQRVALAVARDPGGIAYVSMGVVARNPGLVRAVPLRAKDKGETIPLSQATVKSGLYPALIRPLYLYVSEEASERPEVDAFMKYWLKEVGKVAAKAGYVPLERKESTVAKERFLTRRLGSHQ